ncbi:MAG: DNA-binding protein [Planctomycetota bacterium]|nr:DNA-binding protein [Planctomycetota bacterium]
MGRTGRVVVGRLARGEDLLEGLARVAAENGIRNGWVEAIGAVSRARFGYYDQSAKKYGYIERNEPLELLALTGNVSEKADAPGRPFIHAHVTLADERGNAFGGHLAEGTMVFAAEFRISEITDVTLSRNPDSETGLSLWR